jgi:hypothetical protein
MCFIQEDVIMKLEYRGQIIQYLTTENNFVFFLFQTESWFKMMKTSLNSSNVFSFNIWLIAAIILISILTVYIFYVPLYWTKVMYLLNILASDIFNTAILSISIVILEFNRGWLPVSSREKQKRSSKTGQSDTSVTENWRFRKASTALPKWLVSRKLLVICIFSMDQSLTSVL